MSNSKLYYSCLICTFDIRNTVMLLSMKLSKVSPDHHVPFSSAMKKAQYLRGKTNIIDNGVFTALI